MVPHQVSLTFGQPLGQADLQSDVPLPPFQCIFPRQNQQNVKFLAVCLTTPDKKFKKKCQFLTWKKCTNALKCYTYRFLVVAITVHYIRTLCDKYFLSYDGFLDL